MDLLTRDRTWERDLVATPVTRNRLSARAAATLLAAALLVPISIAIGGEGKLIAPVGLYLGSVFVFSLLTGATAVPLLVGAVRSGDAMAFGPSLGFLSMAALMLAYGLTSTSGGRAGSDTNSQLSALLGLCLPSLFFALSYVRSPRRLDPVIPSSWVVAIGVSALLLAYDTVAEAGVDLPGSRTLVRPPYSSIVTLTSVLMLGFAARRQLALPPHPLANALVLVYGLLAAAQMAMIAGTIWTPAWWTYHLLMYAAAGIAIAALHSASRVSRDTRELLESAFALRVEADQQIVGAVAVLANELERKDRETEGHTVRVARLALGVGRDLGLPNSSLRVLARAGLLHDIGKLGIADEVLCKPGPLSSEQRREIERHPELGAEIVSRLGGFEEEAAAISSHHERFDGNGYPSGLAGEAIPLVARILAAVDTLDALTSDRPYRAGRSVSEALEVVESVAGSQLDPAVVSALARVVRRPTTVRSRPGTEPQTTAAIGELAAPGVLGTAGLELSRPLVSGAGGSQT